MRTETSYKQNINNADSTRASIRGNQGISVSSDVLSGPTVDQLEEALEERVASDRRVSSTPVLVERRVAKRRKTD